VLVVAREHVGDTYSTKGVRVPMFAPFRSGQAIVAWMRRNIMMAPRVV
jgi:hypothetical protein